MISRRDVLLGLCLPPLSLTLSGCMADGPDAAARPAAPPLDPSKPVTLVYVGARNCPYCVSWEASAEPRFVESALAARINYRRVIYRDLRNMSSRDIWPKEVAWLRDAPGYRNFTPQWYLLKDGRILHIARGVGKSWDDMRARTEAAADAA